MQENVMGPRCDTCIPGTFHLDEYHDLGCTSCFCNDVTDKCEAARLAIYTVRTSGAFRLRLRPRPDGALTRTS